jgi:hypothetical protein
MAKKYADSNDSAEAWRARMAERDEYWRDGTQVPAKLDSLIERDADAAMARAIAKHGRD